jgi:hypothetical protein
LDVSTSVKPMNYLKKWEKKKLIGGYKKGHRKRRL